MMMTKGKKDISLKENMHAQTNLAACKAYAAPEAYVDKRKKKFGFSPVSHRWYL